MLEDKLKGTFTQDEIEMSEAEFNVAMSSLIAKGLIETFEKDGKTYYRASPLLLKVKTHINSDPQLRN